MYELLVIGKAGDGDAVFSKVEKILKGVKASSVKSKKMAKKALAYPIAKQTEADYLLFNFEAEGGAVKDIGDSLKLEQEDVLRYLIIRTKHGFADISFEKKPSEKEPKPKVSAKSEKVKVEVKAKAAKAKTEPKKSVKTAKAKK